MNILLAAGAGIAIILVMNILKNKGARQAGPAAFKDMAHEQNAVILDVRSVQEFGQGHLEKARTMPLADMPARLGEISAYKNAPVLVYCHAGSRSNAACRILKQNGFANLVNLLGGIQSWKSAGYPVV